MPLRRYICRTTLSVGLALTNAAASAEEPGPQFSLVAHFGRYPASIPFDDPAYRSVGIIHASSVAGRLVSHGPDYVVGVLLTACHVATSSDGLAALLTGASVADLRFVLESSGGAGLAASGSAVRVLPPRLHAERNSRWTVLRVLGCEEPKAGPIDAAFDGTAMAPASPNGSRVQRFRQVDALIDRGNEILPVMIGGAYQTYDARSGQWVTTGIAVEAVPGRSGEPALALDVSAPNRIGGWDDGVSAFPQPSDHVEPLVDIVQALRAQLHQQSLQEPRT